MPQSIILAASALALLAATLSGCGDDKKEALAGCLLEGRKIYPDAPNLSDPRIASAAKLCMQSKGYAVDWRDLTCVTNSGEEIAIGPCTETVQ